MTRPPPRTDETSPPTDRELTDPVTVVVANRVEDLPEPASQVAHGTFELVRLFARAAGVATVLVLGTGLTAAQLLVVDATTPVEPRLPSVIVSGVVAMLVVTTVIWALGVAGARLGRNLHARSGRRRRF